MSIAHPTTVKVQRLAELTSAEFYQIARERVKVIVESPAKAKTIEKYLGRNYHVIASKGHILGFAF